jgi:hypothetical protein
MSVRTINADVLAILDPNCDVATTTIDRLIIAASAIVDSVFENDTITPATILTEIECWLTAHMVASSLFKTATVEKVGDAEIRYSGIFGKGLESTPYGQMVLVLDTTGKMANSGKRSASIYAVKSFDE